MLFKLNVSETRLPLQNYGHLYIIRKLVSYCAVTVFLKQFLLLPFFFQASYALNREKNAASVLIIPRVV